jgi:hypothetical protein
MSSTPVRFSAIFIGIPVVLCLILSISACQTTISSAVENTEIVPNKTLTFTPTSIPMATVPATPPKLSIVYQTSQLNPLDTPHTYIKDTCIYLRDQWDSHNAPPGTVVIIIKLDSINKGIPQGGDVLNVTSFTRMMQELHDQQFQAINTSQLADFLDNNADIPPRSVVLIQDNRRYADNFIKHFRPYLDAWGWPVVNAWDTQAASSDVLLAENIALEKEGWVDHQVYGLQIDPTSIENLSDNYFTDELQKQFTTFQDQFSKPPIAIVWPNGFGVGPVQIAQQLGYRLGFTSNARGPLMFNWVPLAEKLDTMRPSYAPEGSIDAPLMTLPRYTPFQVHDALDKVRVIGKDAAAFAEQNKDAELGYYDSVCAPTYGTIP